MILSCYSSNEIILHRTLLNDRIDEIEHLEYAEMHVWIQIDQKLHHKFNTLIKCFDNKFLFSFYNIIIKHNDKHEEYNSVCRLRISIN